MTRAVVRGDHPGSQAGWRQSVEQRLGDLFTKVATGLQRVISDGDVDITGGNLNVRGGLLQIFDDDAEDADPIWTNLDGPTQHTADQIDLNSGVPLSGTSGNKIARTYQFPPGFTRAHVQLFVSLGTTLSGAGNLTVRPYVAFTAGPAINSGSAPSGSACTASSYMAGNFTKTDVGFVDVYCTGYINGTPQGAQYSNAHLSVSITWLR